MPSTTTRLELTKKNKSIAKVISVQKEDMAMYLDDL